MRWVSSSFGDACCTLVISFNAAFRRLGKIVLKCRFYSLLVRVERWGGKAIEGRTYLVSTSWLRATCLCASRAEVDGDEPRLWRKAAAGSEGQGAAGEGGVRIELEL